MAHDGSHREGASRSPLGLEEHNSAQDEDKTVEKAIDKRRRKEGKIDYKDDECKEDEEDEDEEDNEEDYEEEDEEDEDEELRRKKKRKRKTYGNPFIDSEAVVEEEEEEEEDYLDDDYIEEQDADEEIKIVEREMQRIKSENLIRDAREEELNAEEIARRMKERYGHSKKARKKLFEGMDQVPTFMVMPSMYDSKLWICEVKEAKQMEIMYVLARKLLPKVNTQNDYGIISVFCREPLKKYIYIEAKRRADVQKAIENINHIFVNKLRLVPVQEMAECLKVKSKTSNIVPGSWIRLKKGLYAGDIARVVEVFLNGEILCILIPRLNPEKLNASTSLLSRSNSDQNDAINGKKTNTISNRPPQKLFKPEDYKYRYRKDNGYYTIGNNWINKKGFLEKTFKPSSVITKNVQPTLAEISNFASALNDEIDLSKLKINDVSKPDEFQIGDAVIAISGSLKGTNGTVSSVQNGMISFLPDNNPDIKNTNISLHHSELKRLFNIGDHVTIVGGENAGETGTVVEVLDTSVIILLSTILTEVTAFNKDVRHSMNTVIYQKYDSPYSIGEMVFLLGGAGVVLKVYKDDVVVLTHLDKIQTVKVAQIRSNKSNYNATTTDTNGHIIGKDALVKVIMPNNSTGSDKIIGSVMHVYKNYVFVKSQKVTDAHGIIVSANNKVHAIGQEVNDTLTRSHNMKFRDPSMHPRNDIPYRKHRNVNSRGREVDRLVSQTVMIANGPYKGYMGTVKDVFDDNARVELHSKSQIIFINKNKLRLKDEIDKDVSSSQEFNSGNSLQYRGKSNHCYADNATSYLDADNGSKQSDFYQPPAQTPSHYNSRTPAWNPNIPLQRNANE